MAVSKARESCPNPSSPTNLASHLPDLIPIEDEAPSHVLVAGGKGWAHWSCSPMFPPSSQQILKPTWPAAEPPSIPDTALGYSIRSDISC